MKNPIPGILSLAAAKPPGILSPGAANPPGVLSPGAANPNDPVARALGSVGTRPDLDEALRKRLSKAVERIGATTSPVASLMLQTEALKGIPMNNLPFVRMLFGELTNSLAAQQAGKVQ